MGDDLIEVAAFWERFFSDSPKGRTAGKSYMSEILKESQTWKAMEPKEETKGESMKRMTMKYPNKCKKCGKLLSPGETAFGEKNDLLGKWVFMCLECAAKKEATGGVVPDEAFCDLSKLAEILGFDEAKKEKTSKQSKPHPVKSEEKSVEPKKTYLQLLAANAKWRM